MCNIETVEKKETRSPEEKMKRMRTALKAVGGWLSYLMGNGALFIAILNPFGFEPVSFVFGVLILLTSITLLYQYTKNKPLDGIAKTSRYLTFTGAFILIPSFVITRVLKTTNPNYNYFYYSMIISILVIFIGKFIIKKLIK